MSTEIHILEMRDFGLVLTHEQIQQIIRYHVFGWLPVLPAMVASLMFSATHDRRGDSKRNSQFSLCIT